MIPKPSYLYLSYVYLLGSYLCLLPRLIVQVWISSKQKPGHSLLWSRPLPVPAQKQNIHMWWQHWHLSGFSNKNLSLQSQIPYCSHCLLFSFFSFFFLISSVCLLCNPEVKCAIIWRGKQTFPGECLEPVCTQARNSKIVQLHKKKKKKSIICTHRGEDTTEFHWFKRWVNLFQSFTFQTYDTCEGSSKSLIYKVNMWFNGGEKSMQKSIFSICPLKKWFTNFSCSATLL